MGLRRYFSFHPVVCAVAIILSGCVAVYEPYKAAGGGTDTEQGQQHDSPYPADDTFVTVKDVLNGSGILYTVSPNNEITTDWTQANEQSSFLKSLVSVRPQYRYHISVVATGPRTSRIIANLEAQDIPDADLTSYLPEQRIDLFQKFDTLIAKLPPPSPMPHEGGVNFALLPGEDLPALAKRATGNADNWHQIAKDNGLTSPNNLKGVTTIWVRDDLLSTKSSGK